MLALEEVGFFEGNKIVNVVLRYIGGSDEVTRAGSGCRGKEGNR